MAEAKIPKKQARLASCHSCRKRKIKCDTNSPCTSCLRSGIDCIAVPYSGVARGRKGGRKPLGENYKKRIEKLEYLLEGLQQRLPIQQDVSHSTQVSQQTINNTIDPSQVSEPLHQRELDSKIGHIHREDAPSIMVLPALPAPYEQSCHGELGGSFWISLNDEIHGLREVFGNLSDDVGSDDDDHEDEATRLQSVPDTASAATDTLKLLLSLHAMHANGHSFWEPPAADASFLCSVYFEKIDPIFKVIHRPSMYRLLTKQGPYHDRAETHSAVRALKFAIFYAATTALSESECWQHLAQSRQDLLLQTKHELTIALAMADCINTTDIVTLQALVIFLLCLRTNDNSRLTWTLIGLAVRIAHALGLHRDVTNRSLSPFDQEMRRRLWWQLCVLDAQASNDRASDPCILAGTFDTPFPTNINDEDIAFGATIPTPIRSGVTDMTLSLITFELSATLREVMYVPPAVGAQREEELDLDRKRKIDLIDNTKERIEQQYLSLWSPSEPRSNVARKMVDLCARMMWLTATRPMRSRASAPKWTESERACVLENSICVLELALEIDRIPSMKWLSATYVQWHALAVTLTELSIMHDTALFSRAWKAVDAIFDMSADHIADSVSGLLWRPLRKLMVKARRRRMQVANATFSMVDSHADDRTMADSKLCESDLRTSADSGQSSSLSHVSWPSLTPADQSFCNYSSWQDLSLADEGALFDDHSITDLLLSADWDAFVQDFHSQ